MTCCKKVWVLLHFYHIRILEHFIIIFLFELNFTYGKSSAFKDNTLILVYNTMMWKNISSDWEEFHLNDLWQSSETCLELHRNLYIFVQIIVRKTIFSIGFYEKKTIALFFLLVIILRPNFSLVWSRTSSPADQTGRGVQGYITADQTGRGVWSYIRKTSNLTCGWGFWLLCRPNPYFSKDTVIVFIQSIRSEIFTKKALS